jgi:hypothetical protein
MAKKVDIQTITKDQYYDKENLQKLKEEFRKTIIDLGGEDVKIKTVKISSKTVDIKNPIEAAGKKDAFRLGSTPKQFYLRFGYLLEYIYENVIPRIKIGNTHNDNPQMFDIDFSTWENFMYSLPNQISLDPRICIVRNSSFYTGNSSSNTQIFQELSYFRQVDNGKTNSNSNVAYSMNIYLNFDFILECLKTDDKGDVSIFEFLSSICNGLNKALGGINNLEPVIDETTNTLSIIDTTPIPGKTSSNSSKYVLQVYGYDKVGKNYISNFVRNVDLKTAITPEFATMVTVGATAGGYVKGTEATAFSKFNAGLRDRFKEDFTPGNASSVQSSGTDNEAEVNYTQQFASSNGYITRYGLTGLSKTFKLNTDAIERNLSVVTEYYKYLLNKESKDEPTSGGIIGFIPFKLSLTLDGISGIKIYNKLSINTEFLPKVYGKTADLIVTGVSHNLSGNDWKTQIETTLIPKTGKQSTVTILPEVVQQSVDNASTTVTKNKPNSISSCNELPPAKGMSSSAKGLIKASTTKDSIIVQAIVDYLEGGYYHPTHAYDSKTGLIKPTFSIYKNSGETLYGIDRFAGNTEGIKQGPKNQTGIDFWAAVDAISGFGSYKDTVRTTKTGKWDITKNPRKKLGWNWNYMPKKSDKGYDTLQKNLQKYITNQYTRFSKSYFGNHPLGKLVESDGRLKFLFYRATWNGVGFFQKYANNLKAVYDKGEKDIDKLICADLTFRYNKKASAFKPGVSKMAYMIDYKKP